MRSSLNCRHWICIPAAVFVFSSCLVFAQKPSPSGPGSGSAGGGSMGRSPSTPANGSTPFPGTSTGIPTNNPTANPNGPTVFLSGRVIFDDGTPVNSDIRIERVCGGNPRLETHTDSKGKFYFQLGQNQELDVQAADDPTNSFGRPTLGQSQPYGQGSYSTSRTTNGLPSNVLWDCDLRASYPGYRSDLVSLANRHTLDNPEIGTIVLHRLAQVKGTTISLTSALAPKHAEKEYDKGMQMARKGDFEEAEKHLAKATESYPKYAVAWFAMGDIQQRTGRLDDARKSFEAAVAADSKYVSPYDRLALITGQQAKWEDAAAYSKQAIELNPVEFPSSFWYNAVANYNLKKKAEAEKSVRELLKLDTAHKVPSAENLLAQILIEKGAYSDAAVHLRAYLALVPNAKDADQLKQALLKIDQASAATNKQQ